LFDTEPGARSGADKLKIWAASLLLTFAALAILVVAWAIAIAYLHPVIGPGAYVIVAVIAAVLSYGVGRAVWWLAKG
jgi:uncharacterized membrane protein YhaH (DUF805 family)